MNQRKVLEKRREDDEVKFGRFLLTVIICFSNSCCIIEILCNIFAHSFQKSLQECVRRVDRIRRSSLLFRGHGPVRPPRKGKKVENGKQIAIRSEISPIDHNSIFIISQLYHLAARGTL
jgi:hypothetical protein